MTQQPASSASTSRQLADIIPEGPSVAETGTVLAGGKGERVQQMFDRIAGRYDLLNHWISMGFHRAWKRRACDNLRLNPGDRVLDVCTGTGDLIELLLDRVGPSGEVTGLDFSSQMLAIARERLAHAPNVRFDQGDAMALPYADHTFDGAIISFGLRNVTDIPVALSEMHRVIKPGGWMVNLDTAPSPPLPGFQFYFSHVVPWLGGLLARDAQAYRYLSESTRHFLSPDELKQAFIQAGCQTVSSQTLMWGAVSLQAGQKAAR